MEHRRPIGTILVTFLALLLHACTDEAPSNEAEVRSNVIYGRVSNTALLMDVLVPAKSDHTAIIAISGSAWGSPYPTDYDQPGLKDDHYMDPAYFGKWCHALQDRGYTVFVIDHRFAPRFKYADIIADCRRAVRYVRFHAREYDVDPARIGVMGHSSGGNLAALLGTTDTLIAQPRSGVDSCSSRVQAVMTMSAPFDLSNLTDALKGDFKAPMEKAIIDYMGELPAPDSTGRLLYGKYAVASPIAHVTADDAPFLIHYSADDPIIPTAQAEAMHARLMQEHVDVELVLSDHAQHNPKVDMDVVDAWFKKHLARP